MLKMDQGEALRFRITTIKAPLVEFRRMTLLTSFPGPRIMRCPLATARSGSIVVLQLGFSVIGRLTRLFKCAQALPTTWWLQVTWQTCAVLDRVVRTTTCGPISSPTHSQLV